MPIWWFGNEIRASGIGGTSADMVRNNGSAGMVSVGMTNQNDEDEGYNSHDDDIIVNRNVTVPIMPVRGKSSGARKRVNESASGASVVTHDDGVVSNGTSHGSDFRDMAKRACR